MAVDAVVVDRVGTAGAVIRGIRIPERAAADVAVTLAVGRKRVVGAERPRSSEAPPRLAEEPAVAAPDVEERSGGTLREQGERDVQPSEIAVPSRPVLML